MSIIVRIGYHVVYERTSTFPQMVEWPTGLRDTGLLLNNMQNIK